MLLVLDNLEQVLAAAPAIAHLMADCPDLKVLTTSRAVLHLSGEWVIPVPPLALPEADRSASQAELMASEAVRLFVERAQAAQPDFALSETNGAMVLDICRRLEGLPLAIELAAARLRHLPLEALLTRLDQRLPMLTGGPRDQPVRLRTMHDAIAWSHDLLSPKEQALFRRLAAFSGGFTPEAAAAINDDGDEQQTLESIASLVDQSLVRPERGPDGEVRYGMLETVREFALQELVASGEGEETQRRHAAWCLDLVEQAWPAFAARVEQEPWLDRLATEHDNLRTALVWVEQTGDALSMLRLAGAMFWFWYVRGHLSEGRTWFARALEMPLRNDVLGGDQARALYGAGLLAHFQGQDAAAIVLVEDALARWRKLADGWGIGVSLLLLGILAEDQGDYDEAAPRFEEALAHFRAEGDRANEALTLYHFAIVTWGRGDLVRAIDLSEEALVIQRAIRDRWGAIHSLSYLGLFMTLASRSDRAVEILRESLRLRREVGVSEGLARGLANVATLAVGCGQPLAAARLFGAEETAHEIIGSIRELPERSAHESAMAAAVEALGADAFRSAWQAGRELTLDQAIEEAIRFDPASIRPASRDSLPANHFLLTGRELEVLRLLATGRTNVEIADALFVSPGTVRNHVSNILGKLGARTRTEAADLARRHDLL
jgi:non-specific serine/threonine protein kinase